MSYFWTSEAVATGHPDKVADQVADAILDAHLALDPTARVASEVTLTTGLAFLTGEITSTAKPDIEQVVRRVVREIGYDRPEHSYDGNTIEVIDKIKDQSLEISRAVTKHGEDIGAGDQGVMFGYATNESPELTPLTHWLSFEMIRLVEESIKNGRKGDIWLSPFLPDAKSQVTILYDDEGIPLHVDTVVISACHRSDVSLADLRRFIAEKTQASFQNSPFFNEKTKWLINPAGAWHIGGPAADTGLSGRKIVVDNYGADCPVGGGSFSGKDPTKVDRSAAYAARHVAKNIVAAGLAKKCQVQLSYAIGVVEPVSIRIQTFGTGIVDDAKLSELILSVVSFSPRAIIERFNLRTPIYRQTAAGGHFGRPGFPWERLDLVEQFRTS